MYEIKVTKHAAKDLKKLDNMVRLAATRAMNQLSSFPNITELDTIKGHGLGVWRKKFKKDWRIIFFVDEERLVITVTRIGTRGELYKVYNRKG